MPTYEYQCDACEHNFEEYQPITAEALKKCPECGKRKLRRVIGAGGAVIFKGSGFYQTDYRSDSYRKGEKAESKSSEGKSGGKESKSAESKPDSGGKSESKGSPAKSDD